MKHKPLTAHILSAWTTALIEGITANIPQLSVDYPDVDWQDVTGQPAVNLPTDPNFVLLACRLDQATLDDILRDPKFEVMRHSGESGNIPDARLNRVKAKMPGLAFRGKEWAMVRVDLVKYLHGRPKKAKVERV